MHLHSKRPRRARRRGVLRLGWRRRGGGGERSAHTFRRRLLRHELGPPAPRPPRRKAGAGVLAAAADYALAGRGCQRAELLARGLRFEPRVVWVLYRSDVLCWSRFDRILVPRPERGGSRIILDDHRPLHSRFSSAGRLSYPDVGRRADSNRKGCAPACTRWFYAPRLLRALPPRRAREAKRPPKPRPVQSAPESESYGLPFCHGFSVAPRLGRFIEHGPRAPQGL
mmetsp:Transcript_10862/g.37645  ORF Transcript_10862/g.37645 Transcript_10862/m.37645 type:complete len:226 (+) Transcript_10862:258-935(+)